MQKEFNLNKGCWGGRRSSSGRSRIQSKGVAHMEREKVSVRTPLHINFKYRTHVRNKTTLKLLKRSIQNARSHGLRVIHYSFQSNHVHLIVEALNNEILTRGMRSLTITFAKGLKIGRVQVQRYHLHVLRFPREIKNALNYVLFNQQKHETGTYSEINDYCSLVYMKNGQELVKKFAREKKLTLKIEKREEWTSDASVSFLLNKVISSL